MKSVEMEVMNFYYQYVKMDKDLFGNTVEKKILLSEKFGCVPLSVLNTNDSKWVNRKKKWIDLGIKSEVGRNATSINISGTKKITGNYDNSNFSESTKKFQQKFVGKNAVSIFDPSLTEIMYQWFCPRGGKIIDPFAGGSVRGIVANYLGYKYTGVELRKEQVDSNRGQSIEILEVNNQPQWYVGDSQYILNGFDDKYDLLFSCPPYFNLEVYSDLSSDLSNMNYDNFLIKYRKIIELSISKLKRKSYAIFVVGEVRDKKGYYLDFVGDTKRAFMDFGCKFYNELILVGSYARASMVANNYMNKKKVPKIHQNVLIFYKP